MLTLLLLALAEPAAGASPQPAARPRDLVAVRLASSLAARHGAGLAAVQVSGPLSQEGGCVLQLPSEAVLGERRAGLEALLREVMPPGLTADVLHAAGFAHLEILKAARVLGPDLLVLGEMDEGERCRRELAPGHSPGAKSEAGDAALRTALGAHCPVLAAGQAHTPVSGPFERILVGVELFGEEAALPLLQFAARLAAREGAELVLLHALAPEAVPPPQSGSTPLPYQEDIQRRIARARDRLAYLCQGLPGADRFVFSLGEGAASVELLKQARERQADLIIVAPRHADGGGVAARVLAGARCPVLLLGPAACAALAPPPPSQKKG